MKIDIKGFFSGIVAGIRNNKADLKMGVGTAGVVGGTVFLCKEAVKAHEIITEYRETKKNLEDPGEIRALKFKTAGKVTITMAPGAVLEAAGLGLMWNGYSDAKAALVGIGMAYSGLQEFIDKYREGVREKYGEEEDARLAYQFRTEEVVIQDENGVKRTETIRIYPHDPKMMPSPYARYFCFGEADGAERSFEYNKRFLTLQQELMQGYFRAHKKFMLNDCFDMLGIKRSKAGNRVGWVYDPEAPEGDNRIDLRIQEIYREKFDNEGNPDGYERVLMIDPNVDGMVEDKMIRMGLMDE